MEERGYQVIDEFDEAKNDMTNGFPDLLGKFEEMDADGLRREIQILMMIGHQQMAQIHLLRTELSDKDKEMIRRASERSRMLVDICNICDTLDVPFDQDYDSPHVALRHAIKRIEIRNAQTPQKEGDALRYVEVIACAMLCTCFVIWTVLMVSTWIR